MHVASIPFSICDKVASYEDKRSLVRQYVNACFLLRHVGVTNMFIPCETYPLAFDLMQVLLTPTIIQDSYLDEAFSLEDMFMDCCVVDECANIWMLANPSLFLPVYRYCEDVD